MDEQAAAAGAGAGAATGFLLIQIALIVFFIIVLWKIFSKAGQPGWAAIIPFYNVYIMLKIAGKPGWWLLLCLIPVVNIVIGIIVSIALAQSFGKGTGFGIGLFLLWIIFAPILAFGSAQYVGPAPAQA